MKLVKLGMVCGALLVAACGGDDGATGPAGPAGAQGPAGADGSSGGAAGAESINGITPARSFPGRTVRMTISGDNTNWTAAPTVTFDDPALSASDISVASPTALVLEVKIGDDATFGDKTITVGGQAFKGFRVQPAATATVVGDAAQGSILLVDVKNNDPENFFDTSTDADGNFVGVAVGVGGDGVNIAGVGGVSVTKATGTILVDVDAAAGERSVFVENTADELAFATDSKVTIAARAPEALTFDGDTTGTQVAFGSKLFRGTLPAASTNGARIIVSADSSSLFGLPTGKWADGFTSNVTSFGVKPGQTQGPFLVLADLAGDGAGAFALSAGEAVEYDGKEAEPNETGAAANALALGDTVYAELSAETDVDWFKFTTTATQNIHVVTDGPDHSVQASIFGNVDITADTAVTVYAAADLTTALFTADNGYGEDVYSTTTLPPGNYVAKITVDPAYYNPANISYSIQVTSEAAPPPEPN